MYIDLVVLIILILAVIFFFKRFSSFVYLITSLDILYRLLHFIADNIDLPDLTHIINKYIPYSMIDFISKYVGTSNVIYTLLIWGMFIIYCFLLFYIIRILVKRKY